MATIIGRSCDVAISADGVTYTEIGKIVDASLSISDDIADETNNDSAGFKESKYADSQATLDVSFKYNSADAGQSLLWTAKFAKTPYYFRFRPIAATGELQFVFQANISDLTVDASEGDVEDGSFTAESTGTITKSAQS